MAETKINFSDLQGGKSYPLWATEATMAQLVTALKGISPGSIQNLNKSIGKKNNPRTFTGALHQSTTELSKLNNSSDRYRKAIDKAKNTLSSGAMNVADSIANSSGKFSDLNAVIDISTGLFSSVLNIIPVVGDGLGELIEGFGDFRKSLNEVSDTVTGFVMDFQKIGMDGSTSILELSSQALQSRINLEILSKVMRDNTQGFTALFGNIDAGAQSFLRMQKLLVSGPGASKLEKFGMTVDEVAEFLGEFVEVRKRTNLLVGRDEVQIANATFDLAKNMRILKEFTGEDIDEQRKALIDLARNEAFMARIRQLQREGRTQEAERILQFVGMLKQSGMDQAADMFIDKFSIFGETVSTETALMETMFREAGGINDIVNKVISGNQDILDIYGEFIAKGKRVVDSGNTDFLAQLGFADPSSPIAVIAQEFGKFAPYVGDVATFLENAKQNADNIDADMNATNKSLLDGAAELDRIMKEIMNTIVQNSDKIFDFVLDDAKSLALGFKQIAEGDFIKGLANLLITGATGIPTDFGSGSTNYGSYDDINNMDLLNLHLNSPVGPAYTPGLALGGPTFGNSLYTVGEQGKEGLYLTPGSTGYVFNNGDYRKMVGLSNLKSSGGNARTSGTSSTLNGEQSITAMLQNGMGSMRKELDAMKNRSSVGATQTANLSGNMTGRAKGGAVAGELSSINRNLKKLLAKASSKAGYY